MSHVGKDFPVVDRRDFNLNVSNNNDGFAHRYLCHLNFLPDGIGNVLTGSVWDCGPDGVDPPDRMFWGSDPEVFAPFVYDVIMEASIVNGGEYIKRVIIREAISGVIARFGIVNDPSTLKPVWPPAQHWEALFLDPFFFHGAGTIYQINCFRKTWTDGPPH